MILHTTDLKKFLQHETLDLNYDIIHSAVAWTCSYREHL